MYRGDHHRPAGPGRMAEPTGTGQVYCLGHGADPRSFSISSCAAACWGAWPTKASADWAGPATQRCVHGELIALGGAAAATPAGRSAQAAKHRAGAA